MKSDIHEKRRSARMMLGRWGCWMQRIEQLEKERTWAQQWLDRCSEAQQDTVANLIREINREVDQLLAMRKFMAEMMDQMLAEQAQILQLRYMRGLSWQAIAIRTNYDPSSARRIEAAAVDRIAGCMEIQAARF